MAAEPFRLDRRLNEQAFRYKNLGTKEDPSTMLADVILLFGRLFANGCLPKNWPES